MCCLVHFISHYLGSVSYTHLDNLDDFEDDRRSRLLEITERWLMPAVIFVAGVISILAVCARLEAL